MSDITLLLRLDEDEGIIDWEAVEYAEDLSKAVEELERIERRSKLEYIHSDDIGAQAKNAAATIPPYSPLYSGDVESFTINSDVECAAEPVFKGDVSHEFTMTLGPEGTDVEHEGTSNVESPAWYHEDEQHGPDGHVACPRCEYYPLNYTVSGAQNESARLELDCPHCDWESEVYEGDDAISALSLLDRAQKFH